MWIGFTDWTWDHCFQRKTPKSNVEQQDRGDISDLFRKPNNRPTNQMFFTPLVDQERYHNLQPSATSFPTKSEVSCDSHRNPRCLCCPKPTGCRGPRWGSESNLVMLLPHGLEGQAMAERWVDDCPLVNVYSLPWMPWKLTKCLLQTITMFRTFWMGKLI